MMRYLVQSHDIELRQLRAIAMGKAALSAGETGKPSRLLPEFGEWTSGCSSLFSWRMARPRSTGAPPSHSRRCPRSASARDNRDSARSARARAVARGGTGGPADPGAFAAWRRAAVFAASVLTRSPRQ